MSDSGREWPSEQSGPKIPDDLKSQCPLCAGKGFKERGSFVDPCMAIMGSCHACNGRGWMWALDQQEMAERIARLEQENAALKTALKHATDEVVDANLHWASKCEEADALKAENKRLTAPVSDKEWKRTTGNSAATLFRRAFNIIIADRAGKEPQ